MSSSDFSRKTLGIMNIDAKWESINLIPLKYIGTEIIQEGRLVVEDATTGKVRPAVVADKYAYLNWSPSNMTTVSDYQQNVFDDTAPVINLEAGGLSGLLGNGVLVHIRQSEFDSTGAYAVGNYICVSATTAGQLTGIAPASISGKVSYGVITKVTAGRVFFIFTTVGVSH